MEEIEINDKNIKMYQEYVEIHSKNLQKNNKIESFIADFSHLFIIGLCLYSLFSMSLFFQFIHNMTIANAIPCLGLFLLYIPGYMIFGKSYQNIITKKRLHKFKKQYPDFDMCLSPDKLKKLIYEYKVEKSKEMVKEVICTNEKEEENTLSKKEELEADKKLLEEIKKMEQTNEVQSYLKLLSMVEQIDQNEKRQEEQVLVKSKIDDVKRRC